MILRLIKVTPNAKETLGNILSSGWLWKSTTTECVGKTDPDQALHPRFGKPLKCTGQKGRKNFQGGLCTAKNRSFLTHSPT